MKRYGLALDLKDDQELMAQYIKHHQKVWPEIIESIKVSGIVDMQIFHVSNRLFMIIEAEDDFSFERKAQLDQSNPKVEEWEALMDEYQQRLPFAVAGEKWVLMKEIFKLSDY